MTARICLVEDDATIRELLGEKLIQHHYDVDSFAEAEEVEMNSNSYDLYILDVLLQGEKTGLDLCEVIRSRQGDVPILILSALAEPNHRIEGLRLGADDYLGKPFEMEELLLRVEGMLKRRLWYSSRPTPENFFRWDAGTVDFSARTATAKNERHQLSQKECMILKLLIEKEGKPVSRDEILEKVWGYHFYPTTRTVDNFIMRLRKIFEQNPGQPQYFHSVRGEGYLFTSQRAGI